MANNRKDEIVCRFEKCLIYQELSNKCNLAGADIFSQVIGTVLSVANYSMNKLKVIIRYMPEFTLHDEVHIFNMLDIIGRLLPRTTLEYMSIPDLMMVILAACLHDIGMAPEENLVRTLKNQLSIEEGNEFIYEYERFKKFRSTYNQEINNIAELNNAKEYSKAQLIEDFIVSEYIRTTHNERVRDIISKDWKDKIKFRDTDLTAVLADICYSHTTDYTYLLGLDSVKLCDSETYLCIPFVAALIRIADILDFDKKRTPRVLFTHLSIRNPISAKEWNKHLAINAWSISPNNIVFSAECNHPAIEASIRDFCDLIDDELRNCTIILSNINSSYFNVTPYKIRLPSRVDRRNITPARDISTGKTIYNSHNTKFTLKQNQVIDLLMGTKLYGNPEVTLRELLQNSIDACLLRKKLCDSWNEIYQPKITVSYFQKYEVDYLSVEDNGIGMDQHIVDNFYTNIGSSYYKSNEFYELLSNVKSSFIPISRFGIGILSCFMVSDLMEVNTKRVIGKYACDNAINIRVEGYDSLFTIRDSKKDEPGTETILQLRKEHPWLRVNNGDLTTSIKKLIPFPPFDIYVSLSNKIDIISPDQYSNFDFLKRQDPSWQFHDDNVEEIEIDLNNEQLGYKGSAIVGLINNTHDIQSKQVLIDGKEFIVSKKLSYYNNCIRKQSTLIGVNNKGELYSQEQYQELPKSSSYLSLHGIAVPCNLFPDMYNQNEKALLHMPFPITFCLNIGGTSDLNLNTARTQILYDTNWLKFEENFYYMVCTRLKKALSNETWNSFKNAMLGNDSYVSRTNADFLKILDRV